MKAVERARAALQSEIQERERDVAGEWEQDEERSEETNTRSMKPGD